MCMYIRFVLILAVINMISMGKIPEMLRTTSVPVCTMHKSDSLYCNGFDQRVATQQLCKRSPLLGYGTLEEAVFSVFAMTSRSGEWWSRDMCLL
jgi:hypothetical protein